MRTTTLVILASLTVTAAAGAQPSRPPPLAPTTRPAPPPPPPPPPAPPPAPMPPPPPPAFTWDSKGWVMLGERTVDGKIDHDRLEVGKYEGKFTKINVVVLDSDLEMIDFDIKFADRTEYHPAVKQYFKENQRTRVIDLPPSEQLIRYIDFKYRNLPGGGRAKVQVWAWKTGDVAPPAPPATPAPPAPVWDPNGWVMLGEREVNGRVDRDRIDVGKYEGKFTKLTIVVENSDLELIDFAVKFGRGAPWRPELKHYFKEGQRTRAIDLPGEDRMIRSIEIKYRNLPGGGRARVQIWGKHPDEVAAPRAFTWESKGWLMLGERVVNGHGREDSDRIDVGRGEGKFRKLTVVVLDSDLEMIDFAVKFGRGEPFHPEVNQFFKESTRTRVIDLPGDDRVIKWIEFKYRNLPGGGKAKVQVWAR
jgi:hypothetical protein